MAVSPIPADYPRVIPYLSVAGAADAIDFYTRVLGATERGRLPAPDGTIMHAEIALGDAVVMLSDANPDWGNPGPRDIGGTPVTLCVYVEDVDETFAEALRSGATEIRPVSDQFYGDRGGLLEDPWGHRWMIQSHIEDVSMEEMNRRMSEMG